MKDKITPKKSLGQNFLTDPSVAKLMVENLGIEEGDEVIEIGSGMGAVTGYLADKCRSQNAHLTAVEFDIDLIPVLRSAISEDGNVAITNANILNFLENFKVNKGKKLKVIGSLPYNITSPLLHKLINSNPMPDTCIFLIQKEVAQKICNGIPDSNYLSVFVQTFYDVSILKIVGKQLFDPIPQVDGAVLKLSKNNITLSPEEIPQYEKFLHHTFSSPRKMLKKVFTKEEMERYGLKESDRPQNYGKETYFQAYKKKEPEI